MTASLKDQLCNSFQIYPQQQMSLSYIPQIQIQLVFQLEIALILSISQIQGPLHLFQVLRVRQIQILTLLLLAVDLMPSTVMFQI